MKGVKRIVALALVALFASGGVAYAGGCEEKTEWLYGEDGVMCYDCGEFEPNQRVCVEFTGATVVFDYYADCTIGWGICCWDTVTYHYFSC